MAKMVDTERPIDIYLSIYLDILHNLMLGVFSPRIFKFRSKSSCFYFPLKIMTSILETLTWFCLHVAIGSET